MIRSYQKKVGIDNKTGETIMETFWEFRVRFIDDDGVEKQKHQKCFKTKKVCEKAMNRFLASKGGNTKREGLNFEYLFNQYKEMTWFKMRPNTIKTNSYIFNGHILPFFRNYLVSNIRIKEVMLFQKTLKVDKKLSDNYVKDITTQLKSFLNYCKKNKIIDELPFDSRSTATPIKKKKAITIWTIEDFNQFILYYENDLAKRALYYTLFYLGVRLEEALALQKRDFNFESHTLKIRRTYIRVDSTDYLEDTTKTESSIRDLHMCSDYESVIEEYFESIPSWTEEERIFPYTQRRVYEWLRKGCIAQKVPLTHPHAFRNSLISNAVSAGHSIKAIQAFVGHSSAKTTLDIYARSNRKEEIEVGNLYMSKPAA